MTSILQIYVKVRFNFTEFYKFCLSCHVDYLNQYSINDRVHSNESTIDGRYCEFNFSHCPLYPWQSLALCSAARILFNVLSCSSDFVRLWFHHHTRHWIQLVDNCFLWSNPKWGQNRRCRFRASFIRPSCAMFCHFGEWFLYFMVWFNATSGLA